MRIRDVTDGTGSTYMVGEKYLNPDDYDTGLDKSDNECMYAGDDRDVLCNSNVAQPPLQDRPGVGNQFCFGSAHTGGFNMAFCDGSTRTINYTITPEVSSYMGNREDGGVVSHETE